MKLGGKHLLTVAKVLAKNAGDTKTVNRINKMLASSDSHLEWEDIIEPFSKKYGGKIPPRKAKY